jgi:hypothetical protein
MMDESEIDLVLELKQRVENLEMATFGHLAPIVPILGCPFVSSNNNDVCQNCGLPESDHEHMKA